MAEKTQVLKLTWENKKHFKMVEDDGEKVTIVMVEENGNIGAIWPEVQNICTRYFQSIIEKIGNEMKAP